MATQTINEQDTTSWVGKAIHNGWVFDPYERAVGGVVVVASYWKNSGGRRRRQSSLIRSMESFDRMCTECGDWCDGLTWGNGSDSDLCAHCDFWVQHANHSPSVVLVTRQHGRDVWMHYIDGGPKWGKASLKGHGGARWTVRTQDGSTVDSDNWWCQGKIPTRFRHMFAKDVCEVVPL